MNNSCDNENKNSISGDKAAGELFDRIATDLNITPTRESRRRSYRTMLRRRYLTRRFSIAAVILAAVGLCVAMYVLPVAISNITTAFAGNKARVSFSLPRTVMVKDITAEMNSSPVSVGREEDGYYYVDVTENGVLILQTETVSGVRSQIGVVIRNLDNEPPVIENHSHEGDDILIYLSDGAGSGVDFAAITAYEVGTNTPVAPLYHDEGTGLVAFAYPERSIRILIPDKAGNTMAVTLEPYVLRA